MPSTFSPSLRLELIADGEQAGVWGATTNNNLGDLLEQAITGNTVVNVTGGNVTLTSLNGVVDEARSAVLVVTGTPGATRIIIIPNVEKQYTVRNTSDAVVQIKTSTGAAFNCPVASESYVYCNGSNVVTGRSITDGANAITSLAAPFTSPAFLGVPTAPTAAPGTNTTQLATTAFVSTQASSLAPLNSPALTGIPTAPTAAVGTNTTQLATTAFVQAAIPAGIITMWSGSVAAVPSGWRLCDGGAGTPDLRDRFIVGAGLNYAVGATGGANTVTLTTSNMPSHSHTGSGTTSVVSNDHTHSGTTSIQSNGHTHAGSGTTSSVSNDHTHSGTTGNQSNGHTHTGSGTTSGQSANHTHSGSTGINSVDHFHGVSGNTGGQSANHTHTYSGSTDVQGAHSHTLRRGYGLNDNSPGVWQEAVYEYTTEQTAVAGAHAHNFSGTTSGFSSDHTHFFSVNSGGVSSNHTHSFTTGANSGDHSHTYSFTTSDISANHNHAFTTGGQSANHTHTYSFTTGDISANHTHTITTGGQSANHTHTYTFTTSSEGGGTAHENRPPYYALAYIIKL